MKWRWSQLENCSIMGVVAQLCGLAVSFVIWLPFIRVWDKKCYQDELAAISAANS